MCSFIIRTCIYYCVCIAMYIGILRNTAWCSQTILLQKSQWGFHLHWKMYVAQHINNAHVQHNTFRLHPVHCAQCTVHNKFPVHMCSTAHSQWVSRLGAATSGALTNCSEVTAKLYGGYRVTSKQTEDLSSMAEWGNVLHFKLNFLLTPTGAALYVPRCHLCLFA